jgi:hypothetical protein
MLNEQEPWVCLHISGVLPLSVYLILTGSAPYSPPPISLPGLRHFGSPGRSIRPAQLTPSVSSHYSRYIFTSQRTNPAAMLRRQFLCLTPQLDDVRSLRLINNSGPSSVPMHQALPWYVLYFLVSFKSSRLVHGLTLAQIWRYVNLSDCPIKIRQISTALALGARHQQGTRCLPHVSLPTSCSRLQGMDSKPSGVTFGKLFKNDTLEPFFFCLRTHLTACSEVYGHLKLKGPVSGLRTLIVEGSTIPSSRWYLSCS